MDLLLNFNLSVLYPEITVLVLTMAVIVLDLLMPRTESRRPLGWLCAFTLIALSGLMCSSYHIGPSETFYMGLFALDNYAVFFKQLFALSIAAAILFSLDYAEQLRWRAEFFIMMLFSLLGMMIMASSNDFITMFLGLELMGISCYALSGFALKDKAASKKSAEAAVKYLIIGSLSTAVLLYGLSLIYGASGTLVFKDAQLMSGLGAAGAVLLMIGFLFKLSIIPFHMWAPDVYEGAPTPVTALLSMVSKAAALCVFARLMLTVFPIIGGFPVPLVAGLSIICMIAGNIMAVKQSQIKRLLGYASISQMGYLLTGFAAFSADGLKGIIFYCAIYTLANIGVFAGLTAAESQRGGTSLGSMAGFAKSSPLMAMAMTVCLLSMAGIPPAGGFVGKFYLFMPTVETGHVELAFVGFIMSMISVYYYLKIVKAMYADVPIGQTQPEPLKASLPLKCTALASAGFTLLLGIWPEYLALLTDAVSYTFGL